MRCFLDMDGVLVDYYSGVCELFGHRPWPYFCRPGDWNFYDGDPMHLNAELVAPKMGRDFYRCLPWLPDGKEILRQAEHVFGAQNVWLLTTPWDTDGCEQGKRDWVKANCPDYKRRTYVGYDKSGCAFPGAVLFDDSDVNCKGFADPRFGGTAVVVPRPWNSRHLESDPATGRAKPGAIDWLEAVKEAARKARR